MKAERLHGAVDMLYASQGMGVTVNPAFRNAAVERGRCIAESMSRIRLAEPSSWLIARARSCVATPWSVVVIASGGYPRRTAHSCSTGVHVASREKIPGTPSANTTVGALRT